MKCDSVLHVRLLSVQEKPVLTSRSSSAVKRVCGLSSISDRNPIDVYALTYCPGWRSCGMTLVHVLLSVHVLATPKKIHIVDLLAISLDEAHDPLS